MSDSLRQAISLLAAASPVSRTTGSCAYRKDGKEVEPVDNPDWRETLTSFGFPIQTLVLEPSLLENREYKTVSKGLDLVDKCVS